MTGDGLYFSHSASLQHETGGHPENADRIRAIEATLDAAGWPGFRREEAPAATREQLERVHPASHIDSIADLAARGGGMIDADTIASAGSWEAARRAAGGAAEAVSRMLAGEASYAFCGSRPPGHHAERARAMGFCLFNNAAVAAAEARASGVERVLIFDYDVHHGNGTEEIFSADPSVLYISIHQSPLYPGTGPASYEGEGAGEGYTINLPVPPGAGGPEFQALAQHVVAPVARNYAPGLIIVSAGFDAHRADPLASCLVESADYGELNATMLALATELDVPLLICLEGGYAIGALAESVAATAEALTRPPAKVPTDAPRGAAEPHLTRLAERWDLG